MAAPINHWSFKLKDGQVITKVMVNHGYIVDGIGFEIVDLYGQTTEWFTGPGGSLSEISLGDGEFLTHISGTYGEYLEETCITTMRIHTNKCQDGYGPYGEDKEPEDVTPFSTPLPLDGSIVGFMGSNGTYLNSIGIFEGHKMIKEYGAYGNKESDINWYIVLNENERFSKVIIKHGFIVDGIGVEVSGPNGKTYTQLFSGPGGETTEIVLKEDVIIGVKPNNEHITQISGKYGKYFEKDIKIASITIHTNLGKYGPFGSEEQVTDSKDFSTPVPLNGSIVGFFGSHGIYLNSIGIFDKYEKVVKYRPYGRI